jgi:hypothetical protein
MPFRRATLEEARAHFLAFVSKTDGGCWKWLRPLDKATGYGRFWVPHLAKRLGAHKAAWLFFKGETEGQHVLHQCDNKWCVNPDHLYLGTHQDNADDAWQRSPPDRTFFKKPSFRKKFLKSRPRGRAASEVRPNRLLNEAVALEIFFATGTHKELAKKYGVSYHTIWQIRHKTAWAWIHDQEGAA